MWYVHERMNGFVSDVICTYVNYCKCIIKALWICSLVCFGSFSKPVEMADSTETIAK